MNVDTYVPLVNLEVGNFYTQVFLIDEVIHTNKMITSEGVHFAKVRIKDVTGDIQGTIWNYTEGLLEAGQFAILKIKVRLWQDAINFTALAEETVVVAPPSNKYDYILGLTNDRLDHYQHDVQETLELVEDEHYRSIICNGMHELGFLYDLRNAPYGMNGPMSYRGGLLTHVAHSLEFAKLANRQAQILEVNFNPSLVIVGCAIRNIGWATTTRFQDKILRPRDAFYMTGVTRASFRYVNQLILTTESNLQIDIPEAKKQALENLCNEVRDIKTLEGRMVAQAETMADIIDFGSSERAQGNWSNECFVGHLS